MSDLNEFLLAVMPALANVLFVAAAFFAVASIYLVWSRLKPKSAAHAERVALLLWLRCAAAVLDLLGLSHTIRRRLGQLRRKKRDRPTVAASLPSAGVIAADGARHA